MSVTRLGAGFREPTTARPVNPPDPGSANAGPVVSNPARDWKKVRQLALRRLERFVSLEPKVLRGDDPDAIHDLRVASRRLQQVLDLLYPKPQPREIRRLRRRIRRCRRAFGNVRNYDVFLGHVDRYLNRKRISRREVWSAIQEYLRARRAGLFQKALRRFHRQNLTGLYVRLREHLRAAGASTSPRAVASQLDTSTEAAAGEFWPRLGQSLEQVWTAFEAQVGESCRNPSPAAIHATRVAAKRLRYLLEVVYEFRVSGCADQLAWLRRLQQHLGDWHDLEVQGQILAKMVGRPAFLRDHLELCQKIIALMRRERAGKKGYEEKYFLQVRDSLEWVRLNQWIAHLLASCSASLTEA
jgi:CHAD domain-containing protein